jgi:hypothetical protein
MTPDKRRPAKPGTEPATATTNDSTQEAAIDTPASQAPIDTPASQGPPRPPAPAPEDDTQQAPIDSAESQAPIDAATGQKAPRPAPKRRTPEPATKNAGASSAPTETGQIDPHGRAPQQPPERSRALHPERVWPD